MAKVSIITINLNNAVGLAKTIKSIVTQNFIDYEYIVIDGGSSDGSLGIIKDYENRLSYWSSEPDNGIYNAMNKGIKIATSEYCLFLNSGDFLVNSNVLSNVFSNYEDVDILYGDLILQNSIGQRLQKFPDELTFYWLYSEFLGHASTHIKRSLFEKIGYYNENYKIVSDWEFFLISLAKYNCSSQHISFPISVLEEGGISNNVNCGQLVINEREQVINNQFLLFKDDYKWMHNVKNNSPLKKIKRLIKSFFHF